MFLPKRLMTIKKYLKTCPMLAMVAFIFSGCYYMTAKRIELDTLILPSGARVLICEAIRGVLSYEIKAFRRDIELDGIGIVDPPRTGTKGFFLKQLVRDMIEETSVHMLLVITPVRRVEREYNPYSVFKGWQKMTYRDGTRDGRPVYRTTHEPVYETEYKHECVRTTYRVFQYDKNGELMGATHIKSTDFQRCPETTSEDVYYNEIEYLISWLKSNILMRSLSNRHGIDHTY